MNKALKAIQDAVDAETGDGSDFDKARKLADTYVEAHPDEVAEYADMTLSSLVQAVDVFRSANMIDSQWRVEAWLLHHFDAQDIGGSTQPQIRIPAGK